MAADAGVLLVLAVDHGHGVPADEGFDAALQRAVAGVGDFVFGADGVLVGGGEGVFKDYTPFSPARFAEGSEEVGGLGVVGCGYLVEGFDPLGEFCGAVSVWRVLVGCCCYRHVKDACGHLPLPHRVGVSYELCRSLG